MDYLIEKATSVASVVLSWLSAQAEALLPHLSEISIPFVFVVVLFLFYLLSFKAESARRALSVLSIISVRSRLLMCLFQHITSLSTYFGKQ